MERFKQMKKLIAITTVAAALLLGETAHAGWYLMAPQVASDCLTGMTVYANQPISQWHTVAAFDTAYACENGREAVNQLTDKALMDHGCVASAMPAMRQEIASAQCVDTLDSRLAR